MLISKLESVDEEELSKWLSIPRKRLHEACSELMADHLLQIYVEEKDETPTSAAAAAEAALVEEEKASGSSKIPKREGTIVKMQKEDR